MPSQRPARRQRPDLTLRHEIRRLDREIQKLADRRARLYYAYKVLTGKELPHPPPRRRTK